MSNYSPVSERISFTEFTHGRSRHLLTFYDGVINLDLILLSPCMSLRLCYERHV